jgi:hypothetical protein
MSLILRTTIIVSQLPPSKWGLRFAPSSGLSQATLMFYFHLWRDEEDQSWQLVSHHKL